MSIPIKEAAVVTLLILLPSVCFAQAPRYSADGDTAYMGEKSIVRNIRTSHASGTIPTSFNAITTTIWHEDIRLTYLAEIGGNVGTPKSLATDNIIGVYSSIGFISPGFDIYQIRSFDFGQSWLAPESVSVESTFVSNLASPDTLIYMSGSTQGTFKNAYFARSFDNGYSWQDYHEFEENDIGYIGKGTLNAMGDSVFITYYVGSRDNIDVDSIVFSYSENRGESWTDVTGIINMYSDMYFNWLRISQGRMHLVFQDFNQGLIDIFYSFSDDYGLTWSDPVFISDSDNYSSQWPYLSADTSGNLCISWYDYKYGGSFTGELLYRISHDNGDTWGTEERLTYDQNCTASRSLINDDYIAFIWEDHYFGLSHANLSFKESYDSGNTWSNKIELTNNGPEHGIFAPEVLLDNNKIYLFWLDDRDGTLFNYEIYFKKGEVSTTSIPEYETVPVVFAIRSVYPNPFNASASIEIHCDPGEQIELAVYDILGSKVKTLFEGQSSFERSHYIWDGTNQDDERVKSGVYFINLKSRKGGDVEKTVLIK